MPLTTQESSGEVGRELGGLALSCVRVVEPMLGLRFARWQRSLLKVGLEAPAFVIHDLGMLCVVPPTDVPIGPRPLTRELSLDASSRDALEIWGEVLRELGESEIFERARGWRLPDELVTVLLLRVLSPLLHDAPELGSARAEAPLETRSYENLEPQLAGLFRSFDRGRELSTLEMLAKQRLRVVISAEQIDLDTLRLVGMFGHESAAAGSLEMLDLLRVFESPEANDVVNFSLDLLPSVLETKRASGEQSYAVDGYAGMARRGTIDSLVLSELAFGEELFARRYAEREVFYYAHEKEQQEERRLHYLLVDASASMRGKRAVFARGLALTLVKKLTLRGEQVYLRFFDSRLYDVQRVRPAGSGSGLSVPYVLTFKGERGRNYAKVFSLLTPELARLARREQRAPVVYLLTHAECHVPRPVVERLAAEAQLYGIFMLPSAGELDLDYLSLLDTVQVVDEAALTQRDARAKRALSIVEHAAQQRRSPRT
ncbi:MAG: VWA domain-containing protein [Deltaproteobacteria bacterium]|nr:VWA domain-containing protein [Deltaproteobacteria bacterium]